MDLRSFKLNQAEAPDVDLNKEICFKKGRYDDVVIAGITEYPVHENAKDKTWINFAFKLTQGRYKIQHFVSVPTVKFTYGEKNSTMEFEKLVRFLSCLGIEINKDNAATLIPQIFAVNLKSLEGKKLSVEIGYKNYYAAKSEAGILLYNREGKPVLSEDGVNPEIFPDFTAAESFAVGAGFRFQKFPEVVKMFPPTVPNDVNAVVKAPAPKTARKVDF